MSSDEEASNWVMLRFSEGVRIPYIMRGTAMADANSRRNIATACRSLVVPVPSRLGQTYSNVVDINT